MSATGKRLKVLNQKLKIFTGRNKKKDSIISYEGKSPLFEVRLPMDPENSHTNVSEPFIRAASIDSVSFRSLHSTPTSPRSPTEASNYLRFNSPNSSYGTINRTRTMNTWTSVDDTIISVRKMSISTESSNAPSNNAIAVGRWTKLLGPTAWEALYAYLATEKNVPLDIYKSILARKVPVNVYRFADQDLKKKNCTRCNEGKEETILHWIYDCPVSQIFWNSWKKIMQASIQGFPQQVSARDVVYLFPGIYSHLSADQRDFLNLAHSAALWTLWTSRTTFERTLDDDQIAEAQLKLYSKRISSTSITGLLTPLSIESGFFVYPKDDSPVPELCNLSPPIASKIKESSDMANAEENIDCSENNNFRVSLMDVLDQYFKM